MDISALSGLSSGFATTAPDTTGVSSASSPATEDRRALIQAVRAVNAAELYGGEHELSFAFDRDTQRAVVRIVDRRTRAVIQQIPSEQALRLAEELKQQDHGF